MSIESALLNYHANRFVCRSGRSPLSSGRSESTPQTTSKPGKKSHKVTNWAKYNESLVNRGDITFWFSEDVLDNWEYDNAEIRAGHPFTHSDLAIETLLMLREFFRLPYRQTEGFGKALVKLIGVEGVDGLPRSLAETAMHRMKGCFGGEPRVSNQSTEVALRCKLLNGFVTLAMPAFVWS